MSLQPEAGLVIRYDYLWRDEEKAGRVDGVKDRPCAIILMSEEREDKSHDVYVCAITHSPPQQGETAVEIPYKVARHYTRWSMEFTLNRNVVHVVPVRVPESLEIQKAVVAKLARTAKDSSSLIDGYVSKLTLMQELRKSLLHKAFSGQLTGKEAVAA